MIISKPIQCFLLLASALAFCSCGQDFNPEKRPVGIDGTGSHNPEEGATGADLKALIFTDPKYTVPLKRAGLLDLLLSSTKESVHIREIPGYASRTGSPVIDVFSDDMSMLLDRDTGRVVYWRDRAVWESNRNQELPAEPQLSREEALVKIAESHLFERFDIDRAMLDLAKPTFKFNDSSPRRGWGIIYKKRYRGYRFKEEAVWVIISDVDGKTERVSYNISGQTPPEPIFVVKKDNVAQIVRTFHQERDGIWSRIREAGFQFDPDTFEVREEPEYVHVNDFFSSTKDNPSPELSMTTPLRLSYITSYRLTGTDGSYYYITADVDAETGKLVKGDYYKIMMSGSSNEKKTEQENPDEN